MPKLEVDHVLRPLPPWREEPVTECGLQVSPRVRLITRTDLITRLRDWGRQRTSMTTCITCFTTAARWQSWADKPGDVIARDVHRGGDERSLIDDELRAIAALIEAHQDEFDDLLAGLQQTTSLVEARRQRLRQRRL